MSRALAEWIAVAVLALAAGWLLFGELGASSLHDGDEALYASVSRATVESGDFVTPAYWGRPFLHKPPLPYWLMSVAAMTLPGTTEFQARFPSALAAFLLVGLTYGAARRLAGFGPALLATSVLLLNHQFLFEHCARSASFDSLLALFMFAALLAGLSPPGARAYRWLFPVLLGVVGLIKAPVVVFPLAVVLVHRRMPMRDLARTAAIAGAVALPWHLYQAFAHGREFWDAYFVYEILGRTGATLRDPAAHMFIHLEAAWKSFLPWSPWLIVALLGVAAGPAGGARSVAFYGLTILAFFCFIPSKWPWYVIPAYPAVAVSLAVFVRRAWGGQLRAALPACCASVCGLWFFFLKADAAYAPVTRPAYFWPGRTRLYAFDPALHGAAGLTLGVVLVALACAPYLRPAWKVHRLAVAAAALTLGLQFHALGRVPQSARSAASRLSATLAEHGIRRIYAVGFFHEERYGGRPEPLAMYYLSGIRGAAITDCGDSLDCLTAGANDLPSAVVLRERGLGPDAQRALAGRLPEIKQRFEVWRLGSDGAHGFESL